LGFRRCGGSGGGCRRCNIFISIVVHLPRN
jgi:hypothetical protein